MRDTNDLRPPGVVLINKTAARRFGAGQGPAGKGITFDNDEENPPTWLTVIGVIKDCKQGDWTARAHPEAYRAALRNHAFLERPETQWTYSDASSPRIQKSCGTHNDRTRHGRSFDRRTDDFRSLTMEEVLADATEEA